MNNSSNFNATRFITGIRAYAALAVVLIHSGAFGLREFSRYTNSIVDFGKYGVIVFFVVSSFTICLSIDRKKTFAFKQYIITRFFRIAPLYYIVLIIAFFLGGNLYYADIFHVQNDIYSLLYHFSFLNYFDVSHQNNFLGVEWSVPIEFMYYLIIPFLLPYFKSKNDNIILALIISGLISVLAYIFYIHYLDPTYYNWSLFKYSFSFTFGILVYIIFISRFFENLKYSNILLFLVIFCLFCFIIFNFEYKDLFVTIFTGSIILLMQSKSLIRKYLFENVIIQYLGEISYSIYLVHIFFFYHLVSIFSILSNPIIALLFTLITSSITYHIIEKPFINLGKRITKKTKPTDENTINA